MLEQQLRERVNLNQETYVASGIPLTGRLNKPCAPTIACLHLAAYGGHFCAYVTVLLLHQIQTTQVRGLFQ